MNKEEKTRVAITAGIAGVILLILVLYLALSGSGNNASEDEALLDKNIAEYASMLDSSEELQVSAMDSASSDSSVIQETAASVTTEPYSVYLSGDKASISGNCFYETNTAVFKDVYKNVKYDTYAQLAEMKGYWEEGNQEAVRELAHLERFEAMSFALNGTKDFYYYGDTNEEGKPSGKGIAVYANDQYYYGDWENGIRSGGGTWISFYPYYTTYVVKEHMFSGAFAGDLPNGEGQEHYDYDQEHMNDKDIYIQNAIGSFANGLYDGEMYLITVNSDYVTTEWKGDCSKGTLLMYPDTVKDKRGYIPVFGQMDNSDNHIWMPEEKTKNVGVSGMISGGNLVK